MATTELPINVEKDNTPEPFSKIFDQYGNSSGFIFDVSLSTAVAAGGKSEERAPQPKGPLSPEMLDKMNRYWRAAVSYTHLDVYKRQSWDRRQRRVPHRHRPA